MFVRMVLRMRVVVRVVMVVRVKALVGASVLNRPGCLPARQVTVSTPMRMGVDVSAVPVANHDAHPGNRSQSSRSRPRHAPRRARASCRSISSNIS